MGEYHDSHRRQLLPGGKSWNLTNATQTHYEVNINSRSLRLSIPAIPIPVALFVGKGPITGKVEASGGKTF